MNKVLMFALMVGVTACAKKSEPEPAPKAAKAEAEPGKVDAMLDGKIMAEALGDPTDEKNSVKLTATIKLKNAGGKPVTVNKIVYSAVVGGERSDTMTWEKNPKDIAPGAADSVEIAHKYMWTGATTDDSLLPQKEAEFDGTVHYTTGGMEKTEGFKLTGMIEEAAGE